MKRPIAIHLLAALLVAVCLGLVACTPGESATPSGTRSASRSPSPSPTEVPFDLAEFVGAAQRQMSSLSSYRVQTTDDYGYGYKFDRIIEFVAPESYHETRFVGVGGVDVTIEILYVEDSTYYRSCFEEDGVQECDSWWPREATFYEFVFAAAGEYGHPWLVAALGLVDNLQLVENDDPETRDLLHIRGNINPLAAQYEAESHVLGNWGTGPNGLPCYPPDPFSEDDECKEFDLEALTSAGRYRSLEALPLFLDLWFTPGSSNVKIYSIRVGEPGHQPTTWRYEYLDYDKVTIQPPDPADIIDLTDL